MKEIEPEKIEEVVTKKKGTRRYNKTWTEEDEKILLQEYKKGKKPRQIAKVITRSPAAVSTKLSLMRKEGIVQ
jgi:DNA-binding NarL/FixJ family response regulator